MSAHRKLTDAELLERAQELARLHARYDAVEEEKKENASTLGQALKGLRKRMQHIAEEVRHGHVIDQAELFSHDGEKVDDEDAEANAG